MQLNIQSKQLFKYTVNKIVLVHLVFLLDNLVFCPMTTIQALMLYTSIATSKFVRFQMSLHAQKPWYVRVKQIFKSLM